MAIAHVRSGSGTGSSATPQVVLAASPASDNLLVAYVTTPSGFLLATNTPSTGWTGLTALSNNDIARVFYKIAGAGESTTQSPITITSASWTCTIAEYSGVDTTTPLDVSNQQNSPAASKFSPSVDPVDAVERLFIGCAFSDGARTYSAQAFSNGSGTVDVRASPLTGTTTAGESQTYWDRIEASSASGTYAATCTCSAADGGGAHIAVFAAVVVATAVPPAGYRVLQAVKRASYY